MGLGTVLALGMMLLHIVVSLSPEELDTMRQVAAEVCSSQTKKLETSLTLLEKAFKVQQNLRDRRAAGMHSGVAFSAVLDHDMDNLGAEQTLVFNQILVNDGQAYNNVTGAFIAPTQGVYVFMFFIGQRGTNEIFVHLTKNGGGIVEAGTQGMDDHQDLQAGNAAILSLDVGDVVEVRHHTWGTHVESSLPLSTFSGFLLYGTEGPVVVG